MGNLTTPAQPASKHVAYEFADRTLAELAATVDRLRAAGVPDHATFNLMINDHSVDRGNGLFLRWEEDAP